MFMMYPLSALGALALLGAGTVQAKPFLQKINDTAHVIGNDLWNVTIGRQYGVKLFYKDTDLVGDAWGHYVSYSTSPSLGPLSWPQTKQTT